EMSFPTALLGHGDARDETGLPWVDLDWEAAVSLALTETAARGHERIVFLASAEHEIADRRGYALHGLDGAREAARRTTADVTLQPSSADPERLRQLVRRALTSRPRPTALVVQHLVLL